MSTATETVCKVLEPWLEDGRAEALTEACRLAQALPVDVDALLVWVRDHGASAERSELATRRLRFAMGLPVIPGPVCRPAPMRR